MKAILLTAGVGRRMGPATQDVPKSLLAIRGRTLLERHLANFRRLGLAEAILVVGHGAESVRACAGAAAEKPSLRFIPNADYRKGSIVSLHAARMELAGDVLVMDADVLYDGRLLEKLIRSPHPSAILADGRLENTGEEMMVPAKDGRALRIGKGITAPPHDFLGEAVGFVKLAAGDARILAGILDDFVRAGKTGLEYEESYNVLFDRRPVRVVPTGDIPWIEIDTPEDLARAGKMASLLTD
ncbi:MAG: phosphocholine cytidylyltransferase family protein [Planctomycetota bacterium]